MILRRTLLAVMALGAAIVTGCSSSGDASLPDAGALLKDSAVAAGGIPKVLSAVQGPKTDGKEDVDGTPTYRVTGTVPKDALSALVPGVSSDANATLWLRQDGGHLPVKASLGSQGGSSVDVTLSDVD